MIVTPHDVASLLGRSDEDDLIDLAEQVLPIVTAQVRGYTRDRGFSGDEPAADIAAVVMTSAARLTANPENLRAEAIGDYNVQRQVNDGWTLTELAILNRYRRRAR